MTPLLASHKNLSSPFRPRALKLFNALSKTFSGLAFGAFILFVSEMLYPITSLPKIISGGIAVEHSAVKPQILQLLKRSSFLERNHTSNRERNASVPPAKDLLVLHLLKNSSSVGAVKTETRDPSWENPFLASIRLRTDMLTFNRRPEFVPMWKTATSLPYVL